MIKTIEVKVCKENPLTRNGSKYNSDFYYQFKEGKDYKVEDILSFFQKVLNDLNLGMDVRICVRKDKE